MRRLDAGFQSVAAAAIDPFAANVRPAVTLKPVLTANRLCLLASVWVMVTANQSFWRLLWREQVPGTQGWLFAASVAMALVGLHFLLFRLLTPGRSLRWALSMLLVVAAATGWFMDTYGVAIDSG